MLPMHMLKFLLHQLASAIERFHQCLPRFSCNRTLDPANFLFLGFAILVEVRPKELLVEL